MTLLRTLRVQFDNELDSRDLPAFRGAVAARAGLENTLFHNHNPDGSLRYLYPLIQYQLRHGRPSLLCLNEGVEAAQHFLQQPDWHLTLADGYPLPLRLDRVTVRQHRLLVTERPLVYQLHQWLALNQANAAVYERTPSLVARLQLLEGLLTGHILAFGTGVGWQVNGRLQVEILDLRPPRLVAVRDHRALAFSGTFRVNAFLPEGIGLGRHVSLGYGTVRPPRHAQPQPAKNHSAYSDSVVYDE